MGQQVLLGRGVKGILRGSEPGQSVLKNVDPQRVEACNSHVYSHVELKPIHNERVMDIFGNHHRLLLFLQNLLRLIREPYPLALGFVGWLYNVPFITLPLLVSLLNELR